MAQDGSVAPRERVNIKYTAAVGDAQEEKELPLKLLMMGDYTLRPDDTPLDQRDPISIDKDNFNGVMREMNLGLTAGVKNRLAEGSEGELAVQLKFQNLKDFEPESVARQVPELAAMLKLREALTALKGPLGNMQGFRKKIQKLITDEDAKSRILQELGAQEGQSHE